MAMAASFYVRPGLSPAMGEQARIAAFESPSDRAERQKVQALQRQLIAAGHGTGRWGTPAKTLAPSPGTLMSQQQSSGDKTRYSPRRRALVPLGLNTSRLLSAEKLPPRISPVHVAIKRYTEEDLDQVEEEEMVASSPPRSPLASVVVMLPDGTPTRDEEQKAEADKLAKEAEQGERMRRRSSPALRSWSTSVVPVRSSSAISETSLEESIISPNALDKMILRELEQYEPSVSGTPPGCEIKGTPMSALSAGSHGAPSNHPTLTDVCARAHCATRIAT